MPLNDLREVTQSFPKETPQAPESTVGATDQGLGATCRDRLTAERDHPSVGNGQEDEQVRDVVGRT